MGDAEDRAERAMQGMEAQADMWAEEVRLVDMVKNATSPARLNPAVPADVRRKMCDRMEAQVDALVRQAFLEGFLRGGLRAMDELAAPPDAGAGPGTEEAERG